MRKSILGIIELLLIVGLTTGCIGMKGYVDPKLKSISYAELNTPPKAPSLGVLVEFQREGKLYRPVNAKMRKLVLGVLRKSKLFSSVSSGTVGTETQLKIVINNTGGETIGHGYATGCTFGLIGTKTIDRYIINAVYERENKKPIEKSYQHAVHATIGIASGPKGQTSMPIGEAVDSAMEQVTLLLLYDLQKQGIL